MNPRKSSTSSGRRSGNRPRYLGLEVAGDHLPPPSPRWWDGSLRRWGEGRPGGSAFRLIRSEGFRAVVEVEHLLVPAARSAWTGPAERGVSVTTVRTWGTLVGAKRWLTRGRSRTPRLARARTRADPP